MAREASAPHSAPQRPVEAAAAEAVSHPRTTALHSTAQHSAAAADLASPVGRLLSELCTDDWAELARVEQKRALAASRSRPRADPALLSMFASTMKLAQTGKITHKNAFQLQLIDHMADIIQQPDETEPSTAAQTRTPLRAKQQQQQQLASATGTPQSTAAAFATPAAAAARSPAARLSDASPASVARQPSSLADITNVQKRRPAKPAVNFVKASSTLDASVMIYSGRVDNVHKDAYRMAGGLTAQRMERDEEQQLDEGTEDEEAADEEAAVGATEKASRARRKRRAASTIESKLCNLNMKQVERRDDGDPFFKRMSAAFDAGGAKGMLTHQLSVYRGAEVALDGQLLVMADRARQPVEGLTQHFDMSELSELLLTTASNWQQLTVCPLMRELEAIRTELEGKPAQTVEEDNRGLDSANADRHSVDGGYAAMDSDDELAGGFAGMELTDGGSGGAVGMDLNELHAEIDAAIVQEQCLDSHMAQPREDGYDDEDAPITAVDTAPPAATSNATALTWIAPGLFGAPTDGPTSAYISQSQLASMAHWKFKAASSTAAATIQRQPRQTKATAPIDFYAGPAANAAFAVVPKKRLHTLRLSVATLRKRMEPSARAALLRAAAATYKVEGLMRLYGRDHSVSIRAKADEPIDEQRQSDHDDVAAAGAADGTDAWDDTAGEDEPASLDAPSSAAAESDVPSEFALLAKPKQVEPLSIAYAQVAKRVDVKRLKECLWAGIDTANDTKHEPIDDEEKGQIKPASVPPTTFQQAIDTLAGRYPANQLASVSVPYCFICVLHLCNEQGLMLESDSLPLSDATTGGEATERRMNLGSFTISAAR